LRLVVVAGTPGAGKTSVLMHTTRRLLQLGMKPAVVKIDCLWTEDDRRFERLGVPVVWDFRSDDVAMGGEGAPLAPFFHFACARWIKAEEPVTLRSSQLIDALQTREKEHFRELEDIGRQFGISKYSSVSSAIEKMKRDISEDRRLKARVKNIEKIL